MDLVKRDPNSIRTLKGCLLVAAICGSIGGFAITSRVSAQDKPPSMTISAATRTELLDALVEALQKGYVFPEVAREMATAIRGRQRAGVYDRITQARTLAQRLTEHLQQVSRDRHLGVHYSAEPLPAATD